MLKMRVSLIASSGAILGEKWVVSENHKSLWQVLSKIALTEGKDGDMLRVEDERGEIIVQMGVATACEMASDKRWAPPEAWFSHAG